VRLVLMTASHVDGEAVVASTNDGRISLYRRWFGCAHRLLFFLPWVIFSIIPSIAVASQTSAVGDLDSGEPLPLTKIVTIRSGLTANVALTSPRAILADSANVYVLDSTVHGIHRFDSRGVWLAVIGKEGDGPNEFRRPTDMGWLSDTLWVSDGELGRLSLIDKGNGSAVRAVQFRVGSPRHVTVPRRLLGSSILGVPQYYGEAATEVDSVPYLLFDEQGHVQDTLVWRLTGRATASILTGTGLYGESDRGRLTISHPFDLKSLTAADPQGRWMYFGTWRTSHADVDHFELLQISATGDTIALSMLPLNRRRASRDDIDSYARTALQQLPDRLRTNLSVRELSEQLRRQLTRPTVPTISDMVAGEEEVLWLRRSNRIDSAKGSHWMAYRFGVGVIGFVAFPREHRLLSAAGGRLWTVRRDGFGVPEIVGWVVSWPVREGR